jgi:hypothetical protein
MAPEELDQQNSGTREMGERTLSFLTSALATDVFPEAEAPAMPITWRVNHGGLYSNLSLIIDVAKAKD